MVVLGIIADGPVAALPTLLPEVEKAVAYRVVFRPLSFSMRDTWPVSRTPAHVLAVSVSMLVTLFIRYWYQLFIMKAI